MPEGMTLIVGLIGSRAAWSSHARHPVPRHPVPRHPVPRHPVPRHPVVRHPVVRHPVPRHSRRESTRTVTLFSAWE